jgi:hypothetical protein
MAGRHRKIGVRARRIAMLSAATATASAMTVSVAPPPPIPHPAVVSTPVDLAAAIRLLPNHDQVPDLTGGLGSTINDSGQALSDAIIRAVVNGINLTGLAQAAGVDPKSLLTTLLADLPANLLPGILASLSLDIPILGTALKQLTGGDLALLTTILNLLPISEVTDRTLTGLLAVLGLDLSDPLNLAGLAVPGLNVITAGPTFTALKMLGLDLGWLPSMPNGVANEINNTPYLRLGVDGVLDLVLGKLQESTLPGALAFIAPLVALITDPATSQLPDVIDLRVIPTVGIGAGAFAAAMAYQQVIDQLKFQPGGSAYVGTDALLGSLTLLPMILINNPGRPDGGAFARFGSLAALFGIDTVNPRTELTGDGGLPALDPLGLHVGGANVLPILIDATYEYQPLSDLASWPNPFTLANNLAAGLLPTYMLRGLGLDGLTDQLLPQVTDALGNVGTGKPLALNLYLTLHSATSPMLEPLYLAADFLNLIGLSPLAQIPMRLANALAPTVNTLTNIGYANVVQNPDGTYTRDFSNAGTETPFLSFADIDYGRVPGDVINQLIGGFTKEFFSANPTPNGPNALANLLDALLGGGLGGILPGSTPAPGGTPATDPLGALLGGLGGLLSGLGGILGGLLGGGTAQLASTGATARSIPDPNPSFSRLSISGGAEDESATAAVDSETAIEATEDATAKPASSEEAVVEKPATEEAVVEKPAVEAVVVEKPAVEAVVVEKPATEEPAAGKPADEGATGPKHAKPDEGPAAGKPAATDSTPKHAKPDKQSDTDTTTKDKTPKKEKPALNVVRDSANASTPKDEKTGPESGKKDKDETAAAASSTGADSAAASSNAA